MRRLAATLSMMVMAAIGAGCGTAADQAQKASLAALSLPGPASPSSSASGSGPLCVASLRPPATLPTPEAMPSGSYMAQIRRRGWLIAGVDQNSYLLAYFNPLDGQLEGFEIDLLRHLARAIFGDANPGRVHFKAITTHERFDVVRNGSVDIVADAITMTCARRKLVDFSSVYYNATQRLLVPRNVSVRNLGDLAGRRVCATRTSTSIVNAAKYLPGAIAYPVDQRTDCLVDLQEGLVDAVTSDDALLLGLQAQDPNTHIVGRSLSPQPYGMAISKDHPDFVRFVNGWLQEIRHDGTWAALYRRWLGKASPTVPAPPEPTYEGSS